RLGQQLAERIGSRCTVVDARWVFRRIRLVKTEAEIALLQRAAAINEAALLRASKYIAAGASWSEMIDAFRATLASHAAKPAGERGMLFGAGPDGSFVLDHEYAAGKRFAVGDSVVLDAISTYRLYHADMARTAVVGEPSARQSAIFDAVVDVLNEAEQALRPGAHTRALEQTAAALLERRGLEPGLATLVFHPIGLNVFDYGSPEAIAGGWTVEPDTVMNFEVFYRDPEAGGIHLEDSVRVTGGGHDRLSSLGRELIVAG
ncbi:MAG: aminopeptidase P family protein, partial [Burkholderiales bacterium]